MNTLQAQQALWDREGEGYTQYRQDLTPTLDPVRELIGFTGFVLFFCALAGAWIMTGAA